VCQCSSRKLPRRCASRVPPHRASCFVVHSSRHLHQFHQWQGLGAAVHSSECLLERVWACRRRTSRAPHGVPSVFCTAHRTGRSTDARHRPAPAASWIPPQRRVCGTVHSGADAPRAAGRSHTACRTGAASITTHGRTHTAAVDLTPDLTPRTRKAERRNPRLAQERQTGLRGTWYYGPARS
jgi:hypothetical protein